ncbi:hypothetical protein B0O40_2505 [Ruminococcaceae bacterium R-25]|nr:hypothetical protein B0O40_2505 [Ruminococcaceae bacterium R-25]SUQ22356.1 hypothetical protein SAMN06297423_2505 [Oscillospiraceae bacterium]
MSRKEHKTFEIILNLIIVIFTVIGIILMLTSKAEEGALQSSGIENFKFYTVLTNVFCGIVASVFLVFKLLKKDTEKIRALKLAAVVGVAITFAVVAFMFGPLYGFLQFYKRGNLYFHLLLPVTAMIEFIVVRRKKMPFRYAVYAAVPTLIYAIGYLLNILINGIGGAWPDTNDFYGFLNWGWPVGIAIFTGIPLTAFGVACIFRAISNKRGV